jgi:hypothetical protein
MYYYTQKRCIDVGVGVGVLIHLLIHLHPNKSVEMPAIKPFKIVECDKNVGSAIISLSI